VKNILQSENSPYLLQHADNPVHWQPWGEDALEQAQEENKPIFLSIGYAACHWCHVMAHESFEDPETAAFLNTHYINIKVDREERPDLDSIYMQAVVALTGQGGWPMSVFLSPDGKPFYGGTYFPPEPRHNLPSFLQVLATVAKLWKEDPDKLLDSADQITAHLEPKIEEPGKESPIEVNDLNNIVRTLYKGYDWDHGGWGGAPKFPMGMPLEFLLAMQSRGNQEAEKITTHALDSMARGGMYDLLGGGFSRYSVDSRWLVPHFEKMLYDNAILSSVYLQAFLITGREFFRRISTETLDFILKEMRDPQGGFYSSLDADSEGQEGKYYIWDLQEIKSTLEDDALFQIAEAAYTLPAGGNFEEKIILRRKQTDREISAAFNLPLGNVEERLQEIQNKLLEAREKRIRPGLDNKVLVAWNGLALTAFANAGRYLKRKDYLDTAAKNADFILNNLFNNQGRLLRSWRSGSARHLAYLEDYAALIGGLIALYQSDFQQRWYEAALQLTEEMIRLFYSPENGFFDTGQDHPELIFRPSNNQDNAVPSGASQACYVLLQMSGYAMNYEWQEIAEETILRMGEKISLSPLAYGKWLQAADLLVGPLNELALIGRLEDRDMQSLLAAINREYRPRSILAQGTPPILETAPEILQNRPPVQNRSTVYLCRDYVCLEPVTDKDELLNIL
jgi:uncharacterized protein YyaL (SSP411 family)